MPDSDSRIFILGVGVAKAGTTWLFEYIDSQCPGHVRCCGRKELRVWNHVRLPSKKTHRPNGFWSRIRKVRRVNWLEITRIIPACYFLLLRWTLRSKGSVTSDITPDYGMLSGEDFVAIRKGVKKHGIEMKVVFLMRDPVERCISHYKQTKGECLKQRRGNLAGTVFALPDNAGLKEYCVSERVWGRTRYQDTVENLEAAFAPEELFFGIHENLFEERSIVALSDFLGVPSNPAFGGKRFNTTKKHGNLDIDNDTRKFVAGVYKGTYAFCATRFPVTGKLWSGFQWLGDAPPGKSG